MIGSKLTTHKLGEAVFFFGSKSKVPWAKAYAIPTLAKAEMCIVVPPHPENAIEKLTLFSHRIFVPKHTYSFSDSGVHPLSLSIFLRGGKEIN